MDWGHSVSALAGASGVVLYQELRAARKRGQGRLAWTLGFGDINSWPRSKKIKVAVAVLVLEPGLFFRAARATLRNRK